MKQVLKSKYPDGERLAAWMEWKNLCDIEKCTAETQEILRYHAESNVARYLAKFPDVSRIFKRDDNWELFENHVLTTSYKMGSKTFGSQLIGKSYKDGIFYKAEKSEDPPLKVFSGEFNAIMRNVIKNVCPEISEEIDRSSKKIYISSLDEKVSDDSDTTYGDLIPSEEVYDPSEESNLSDLNDRASELAPLIFKKLSVLQRTALLAEAIGIGRTDGYLCKLLKISDSTLNDHFNRNIPRIMLKVIKENTVGWDDWSNGADKISARQLVLETRSALMELIYSWSSSEKNCESLLAYIKEKQKLQDDEV